MKVSLTFLILFIVLFAGNEAEKGRRIPNFKQAKRPIMECVKCIRADKSCIKPCRRNQRATECHKCLEENLPRCLAPCGFSTGGLTGVDVETAPVIQPYDDRGSGAGGNFACFNPNLSGPQLDAGYTMVASIPSNVYYGIKSGSVFKPKNETLFSYPNDFEPIWQDGGSGGDNDGSFWKPHCPLGYYALGHYCQKGYDKPDLRSMKCVHLSLVEECTSKLIWTDKGSGAEEDGAAYKSSDPQVMGMYTAPNYRGHPQAYCFKRN